MTQRSPVPHWVLVSSLLLCLARMSHAEEFPLGCTSMLNGVAFQTYLVPSDLSNPGFRDPLRDELPVSLAKITAIAREKIERAGGAPERLRFDSAILDIGRADDKFEDLRWYWNVFYIDPASGKRRWQRNHVTVYLDLNGKGVLEAHGPGSRLLGLRSLPAHSLRGWYPDPIEYESYLAERKLLTTVSSARVKAAGMLDPTQIDDRSAVKNIAAKAAASLRGVVANPKDWAPMTVELKATDSDAGLWVVTFWPTKSETEDSLEILVLLDGTVLVPG